MGVDPQEFRTVIGSFATGVTVITAAADGMLQGMTANAVTSVSLDPILVLVCIDKGTHTHGIVERGRAFAINVLGANQEDVSRLFAQKAAPERGTLRGQPFRIGRTGVPILEDSLAYLECRVTEMLEGGDHSMFLGEVVSQGAAPGGEPLLFFRGRYRTLTP